MKKILFLIPNVKGGGAEKTLLEIVKNLEEKKYDVTVMKIFDGNFYQKEIEKHAKFKSFFKEKNEKENTFFIRIVRKIIRSLPPKILYKLFIHDLYDIEIAFLEGIAVKLIANSSNKNSRKYTWIHTDLENNHWTKSFFKDLQQEIDAYKVFDKCLCVSNDTRGAFERKMHNDNAITLYNPVDEINIIKRSSEKIDNWTKKKFTIITVGRLIDVKGYDRLLHIHNQLTKSGYDYELLILGQGQKQKEFEDYITANNLSKTVKLLGFQANPYKYMAQADLFVCSSRSEGFSTVATEATILGLPIITTKCSGMEELLGNSEYGLIVENDELSLYMGMKKILDNKKLYLHYKEQAKIRANDFKIKQRIVEIEAIFDKES